MKFQRTGRALDSKTLLAFFAIYFIWGSTYLAIKYAVETIVNPIIAVILGWAIAQEALTANTLIATAMIKENSSYDNVKYSRFIQITN